MSNSGIRYSTEFKQTIIDLYHQGGYSYSQLAKEYGTTSDSVRKWVLNATPITVEHNQVVTVAEFKQLQKKYKRLEEENDILKQAAVLLAKR